MSKTSDRQFFKRFTVLSAGLAVMAVGLYAIAQVVVGPEQNETVTAMDDFSIAERIRPVGELKVSSTPVMDKIIPVAHAANPGKSTYDSACMACHASGVAGAPKVGDKAAWKDRIAQGKNKLYSHSIKGFQGKSGVMPAKGGNTSLSDANVKAAVDYMVSKSK